MKVSLLRVYISTDKFDVICISETYLDSDTSNDDNLKIAGYNLILADHPSNTKRVTSQFGLQQLIKEPTHILTDSSSYIDLLFTSQPNLEMKSGVHSSLHQKCHHHIIYIKINFKSCVFLSLCSTCIYKCTKAKKVS